MRLIDLSPAIDRSRLALGSRTGTHCEAPRHFLEDGLTLDELPLDRFVGPGVLVDATGLAPRTPIGWDLLDPVADRLRSGAIVLLHTGWGEHLDAPHPFEHPYLDGDACELLLAHGVRTIGIDAIDLDETPAADVDRARCRCHLSISTADGAIVENLTNLGALAAYDEPLISVLPLNVLGAEGAPARAVAIVADAS